MMNMGFLSLLVLLTGGTFTEELLKEPPRDLASLLNARAVLQQMEVATDEESLIAALKQTQEGAAKVDLAKAAEELGAAQYETRRLAAKALKAAGEAARPHLEKAVQSDDPEVRITAQELLKDLAAKRATKLRQDDDYIRRVLAIRLLEHAKSQKALPELETIAKGDDVTLADAAQQAIAAIKGEKSPRPTGRQCVEELAALLPRNAGFVLLADMERGHAEHTAAEVFQRLNKKPGVQDMNAMMGFMAPDRIVPQVEKGILQALSAAGNVRVDAVAVVCSDNLDEHNGYVCVLMKGLFDPTRLRNTCKAGLKDQRESGGHTIFSERYGPSVCVLDAKTVLITFGPQHDGQHMDQALAGIAAQPKAALSAHIARAFEMMKADDVKLAASGALSEGQKAQLKNELGDAVKRLQGGQGGQDQQIELEACKLVLSLVNVNMFEGRLDPGGALCAKAVCATKEDAQKLNLSLTTLEGMVRQELADDGDFLGTFGLLGKDKKLWESAQDESQVTLKFKWGPVAGFVGLPMLFMMPALEMREVFVEPDVIIDEEDEEVIPLPGNEE